MKKKNLNILHLIQGLKVGGAEVLLLHYVQALGSENYNHHVYYFGSEGYIIDKLKELGVTVRRGKKRSKIKYPIRFVSSHYLLLKDLLKFIRRNRIDVIISQLGQANQLSVVAGKIAKITTFPTVHNTMAFVDRRKWYDPRIYLKKFVDNIIYRIADNILVVSNEIKDIVNKTFCIDASKIFVVKNGIIFDEKSTHQFDMTREFPESAKKLKLIAVGSLTYQKAMDVLIKSASILKNRKFENFLVNIVGEGEEYKYLEELIGKLELGNHVKLLGLRNDVINLMQSCDLFVMPSRFEGLSIAMIEAMACGMPIIASDAPGLRNYISNETNGLLFPIEDSEALADKIFLLAEDIQLRKHLSKAARITFGKEFDMNRNISILTKLIRESAG